ncbi:hypothetical protein WV31_04930 [Magnetospirillum sp. ME-1]|nr:hypothetical protein WV31_04930 [Magnetospirillum sp. ME-1]
MPPFLIVRMTEKSCHVALLLAGDWPKAGRPIFLQPILNLLFRHPHGIGKAKRRNRLKHKSEIRRDIDRITGWLRRGMSRWFSGNHGLKLICANEDSALYFTKVRSKPHLNTSYATGKEASRTI